MAKKPPSNIIEYFRTNLPPDVLEYFRKQGAKGGKIGGKRSLETMTPKQRRERALNAVAAREAKRAKKT